MTTRTTLPALRPLDRRLLTSAQFTRLRDVPAEAEWFANIDNPGTRAHLIAYRDELLRRKLQGTTIRRNLAALSSLYEFLCEKMPSQLIR